MHKDVKIKLNTKQKLQGATNWERSHSLIVNLLKSLTEEAQSPWKQNWQNLLFKFNMDRSARMLGSWVPSGRCFLRHVAFVSTEASSRSLGAQDGAHTLHIKHALFSPTAGILRHVSSWSRRAVRGGRGGGPRPLSLPTQTFPLLEQLARGKKSVSKELPLCFPTNVHS